jgi:GNAT superfamily N-acetyltransferase
MSVEIRREPPGAPAGRTLFAEYVALMRERLPGFEPTEDIVGTADAFEGPGAAWLVLYDDGEPAGCGGLAAREPGVGEIKRVFVRAAARGRGHGRRLLAELEEIARAEGHRRVLLYTTAVLVEARALYESSGYQLVPDLETGGRPAFWLEKEV